MEADVAVWVETARMSIAQRVDEGAVLRVHIEQFGPEEESDSDSESSQAANVTESKPKPGGLSVVRPEILFGDSRAPSSGASNNSSDSQTNPLSLLSNLSGFPPGLNLLNNLKMLEEGAGIKNEFKDLLKLFGVSSDVAENLNPNTEQRQGKSHF